MHIEQRIENKVVEMIREIFAPYGCVVRGSFSLADTTEQDLTHICDVRCGSCSFPSFSTPVGEWDISITIFSPFGLDPRGETFNALWGALSAKAQELQISMPKVSALFNDDVFTAHGFAMQGGDGVVFGENERQITTQFALRGRFKTGE